MRSFRSAALSRAAIALLLGALAACSGASSTTGDMTMTPETMTEHHDDASTQSPSGTDALPATNETPDGGVVAVEDASTLPPDSGEVAQCVDLTVFADADGDGYGVSSDT